jgi:transcriptional regulator with XRE-family HTH domain
MPGKRVTKKAPRAARLSAARDIVPLDPSAVASLARQVRSWTDSVLGIAGTAADVSISAAKALLPKPEQRAALEKSGRTLRNLREAAGLSVSEVGRAIDLSDPALLELVESGKLALPFEITLRLASVLGRNDPISFIMRFTRTYNPDVWRTLERLGIGRLAVQVARERELANIYRGSDVARRLSDEDFAAVLAFTRQAFELAVAFRGEDTEKRGRRRSSRR